MEQKFDNAMRRQVYSIPELITQQYDLMEPRIREALSFQEIFSLQHIIITGCGLLEIFGKLLNLLSCVDHLFILPIGLMICNIAQNQTISVTKITSYHG